MTLPPRLPIGQWRDKATQEEAAQDVEEEEEEEEHAAVGETTSFRAAFSRPMSIKQRECIFGMGSLSTVVNHIMCPCWYKYSTNTQKDFFFFKSISVHLGNSAPCITLSVALG
jgi:hypothetical protein